MSVTIALVTPGDCKSRGEVFSLLPEAELLPRGRARLHVVSASLNALDIAGLVHGPSARAAETARILAYVHDGLEPTELATLADINTGEWAGLTLEALRAKPEWSAWQAEPDTFQFPGGENLAKAGERAVASLFAQAEAGGLLVAVLDPGLIRAVIAIVTGIPFAAATRFDLPPATLTLIHGEAIGQLRIGGIGLRGGYGLMEPTDRGRWPDRDAVGEQWASGGYSRLFRI
ncbi:histidine phosphatase family protein [Novosphingobium sp. MW5]|nr:histidine phosphatase family protein [Novosphingobium sp. MW5]